MDEYQQSTVRRFFESYPQCSPSSCHEFALNHMVPIIFPRCSEEAVDVRPSSFQGSLSYTIILVPRSRQPTMVVQFRADKQDLSGVMEANRIHGSLAPLVTFRGMYEHLFVYTSPFTEGTPYIQCLLSTDEDDLAPHITMTSLLDIADVLTRGMHPSHSPVASSSVLDTVISQASRYPFRSSNLQTNVLTCINKISSQLPDLETLPVALTHPDLSPFNYLIDESTGSVQAVLDWDGAAYFVLGLNFHFIESFFGSMARNGEWVDHKDGSQREAAFYRRICDNVESQGFGKLAKEQLELPRALGVLHYHLKRMMELEGDLSERHLHARLQRLSFMSDCLLPY